MIRSLRERLRHAGKPTARHALSDLIGTDGCPIGAPDAVATALTERLEDDQSAIGALHALCQIEGGMGWLPDGDPSTPATDRPLHRLMCRAQALGWPSPDLHSEGPDWSAWAWRATGCAVAHARLKDTPSRLWFDPRSLQWDFGHTTLLHTRNTQPRALVRARVDGATFSATQSNPKNRLTVDARKARVFLALDDATQVQWTLAWAPTESDQGIQATHANHTLIGKLDPNWAWQIDGKDIVGSGTGPMRCSFELR